MYRTYKTWDADTENLEPRSPTSSASHKYNVFTLSDYPFAARYVRDQLSRNEAADERAHRYAWYGSYGRQLQRVLEHRYP